MVNAAARQWPLETPFTFMNPQRRLSTVEWEARPAEVMRFMLQHCQG